MIFKNDSVLHTQKNTPSNKKLPNHEKDKLKNVFITQKYSQSGER